MITSSPLQGEPDRAGAVGLPLPDVNVRVVDDEGNGSVACDDIGHIQVKAPTCCRLHGRCRREQRRSFTADGFSRLAYVGKIDTKAA